ncbi:MAG TPA: site-specific integrase [Actinomycetes bacterium]|nr:site-specific integrase [Actinomycetes bacterium]
MLADRLVDRYLVFVASRARPNTVLATVSDLRAFFAVVTKDPREVRPGDVLDFIAEQRRPRGDANVVRLVDGQAGLSSQTIKRRLSSVSGLFSWLLILGEVDAPGPDSTSPRRRTLGPRRRRSR